MNILFLCQGNIGRSQIAEALTNHLTQHNAWSAGIDDVGYKYNYRPYQPAIEILQNQYGIDMASQSTKKVNKKMLQGKDLICLLCSEEECHKTIPRYVLGSPKVMKNYISDPNNREKSDIKEIIKRTYDFVISLDETVVS